MEAPPAAATDRTRIHDPGNVALAGRASFRDPVTMELAHP
jgi:hypothetical protein